MAVLPPQDVVGLLEERDGRLEIEIGLHSASRELAAAKGPGLFAIESEYRCAQREARLKWTRALIADISSGTLEGIDLWKRWHANGVGDGVLGPSLPPAKA
jgi:hypothetical protein